MNKTTNPSHHDQRRKVGRLVRPIRLWAAITKSERSEWVNFHTIRNTKFECMKALFAFHGDANYTVNSIKTRKNRFAKIIVQELPNMKAQTQERSQ